MNKIIAQRFFLDKQQTTIYIIKGDKMNNEDISEMIQKLSSMLNNSKNTDSENNSNDLSSNSNETPFENLQNILSNIFIIKELL